MNIVLNRKHQHRALVLGALVAACTFGTADAAVRQPPPRALTTWYVSATATPGGDGSQARPFQTLAQVQAASNANDTIMVLPSPTSVAPLDGGIALKPGQHLVGAGPAILTSGPSIFPGGPVTQVSAGLASVPAITNTTNAANNGDAVTLAYGSEVTNLVITGTYRGGIYGNDALEIDIHGNDLSAANSSGTVGFSVLPFQLEGYTAGQANNSAGIISGWGAVLIDGTSNAGSVNIADNYIHDGTCNDGIEIRAKGTSNITATITGNFVTRLVQCSAVRTAQNNAMQASGNGVLHVLMDSNTQANSGSPGANIEGQFVNIGDSGTIIETINNNAYFNGMGGSSTNGLEFIIGNGVNQRGEVTLTNSTFDTNPGDMLEEFNRGTNSTAILTIDNVIVRNTTISGGLAPYSTPPGTATTPDNTGECMGVGSVGAFNKTILHISNSTFSGCGNNGIEITNNHVAATGNGSPALVELVVTNSSISGAKFYDLWMNNVTDLTQLNIKVQDTNLSRSTSGIAVAFDQQTTATNGTGQATIDLGGGALGSAGRNCVFGGALLDMESNRYAVSATNNWWGQAGGPAPGRVVATGTGGSIATAPALSSAPAACQ